MCPSQRDARRESQGSLRLAFDVLDADRDGRIGCDDLKAFYASSENAGGGGGGDDAIGSMIEAADADRDGYVALDEFERVVLRGGGGAREVMEEVFRMMDRDGDGRVGFADLRGYMDWARLPASDDDVRAMLGLGGGGAEGVVCFACFLRILAIDSFPS